ncbi:hypothetical protein AAZX31_10G083400 [Glycine max]|uniref:uncharacterized protein isoform X1 n=1 Tax=Glycine max TaxID=3847 RepID=UPI000E21B412|nr:uncharacterized protein LOC100820165 isoform X1 [Glycine max]XP_025979841.1 uncharacterized protein LOC100820165 isoform X1 [Glycine max]XP_025979842.1 uncharacterized protein LOC100820165 isoform X1 [Glycine max]XP_025979843.1 uncharacterized protein LOC100820165 isoform X1 [Glycine max]XP_025979844.1 uncharacterized protein LOC100820165 isoform X1 [Glycine max]XP_025979845.1 uncharacterized protein LOC100820165 isoform X1 [Glycine max]XP_040869625.1 uncharacterized protein LOC100820165 i|eukprot:XP_014618520.2 uncharacterized protein LOC100820165 isoform X1 [Glycine max]
MPLPKIVTPIHFLGFLVILPLYFFAPFFCCPCHVSRCMWSFKHMSLPDWRISTLHLISLNNRNSPLSLNLLHVTLSSSIFSTLLSIPQSSFSPSFSFSIFSSFSFIFYLSISESFPSHLLSPFLFLFLPCMHLCHKKMDLWVSERLDGTKRRKKNTRRGVLLYDFFLFYIILLSLFGFVFCFYYRLVFPLCQKDVEKAKKLRGFIAEKRCAPLMLCLVCVLFYFFLFNIRSLLFTIEFMDYRFDAFWCVSCAYGTLLEPLTRAQTPVDPSDIAIRLLEPLKAEFPILSYADFYPVMFFCLWCLCA